MTTIITYPDDITVNGSPFTLGDFVQGMIVNDRRFSASWAGVHCGKLLMNAVDAGREARVLEIADVEHYQLLRDACEKPACGDGGYPVTPALLLHEFLEAILFPSSRT